jgi:hypothetical protein
MHFRSFGATAIALLLFTSGRRSDGDGSTACVPATCEDMAAECGAVDDGCGGTLQCGGCEGTATCGGGGIPSLCGSPTCVPATCAAAGAECGSIPDGCGGSLACGACAGELVCGGAGPNQCGAGSCARTTCEAEDAECGTISDGCAATLDCGGCADGEACGAGTEPNTCSVPTGEPGGATRWVLDVGGAGDEHVGGFGVRSDGVVVALVLVGEAVSRPPGFPRVPDSLGLVWISPEGKIVAARTYSAAGKLHVHEQLPVSPAGEAFLAVGCESRDRGCPDLGAGPIDSDSIVKLSPEGNPVWSAPCEGCGVLAADRSGGVAAVTLPVPIDVLKLSRDGEREWGWTGFADAAKPSIAFVRDGSAVIGQALRVYKVGPGGEQVWIGVLSEQAVESSREGVGGYAILDVGVTDGGVVIAAGTYSEPIALAGETIPLPTNGGRGVFLAAFSGTDGTLKWVRSAGIDPTGAPRSENTRVEVAVEGDGSVALLASDGCALRVERWSTDGARRWSRSWDAACTTDRALFPRGFEVGPQGDVLVGGGFEGPVDFGTGTIAGRGGTDGFVVDLAP